MTDQPINPLTVLEDWLKEANLKNEIEPTACAVATSTPDGKPSVRILLFKGLHQGRLAFVTNYESRKAEEIASNPYVALSFYWKTLVKQIRVEGRIEKAAEEFSDTYWQTRPRESQLSGWASPQSRPIKSQADLDARLDQMKEKFKDQEIPRPQNWGAYFVNPEIMELWVGQQFRMHERKRYTLRNGLWISEVLGP